ncbi:MAG TPA: hypothetical protein VFT96_07770 [Gemmatimonadaceae bacterium]|nr:hypothetical protein [Gemmatimonadaceae bacterium]
MAGRSLFGAVALATAIIAIGCTDSTSPVGAGSTSAPLLAAKPATKTVCQTLGAPSDPRYQELTVTWRGANGLTRHGTNYVSDFFRECPPPPNGYAPLYLCNVASSQSVVGTSINFLVDGSRSVTLAAGESFGPTSCIKLGLYAVGASVTLQELVPAGIVVSSASFSYNPPGGLTDYNAATALATIAVGPVTNVFTFSNGPATS